MSRLLFAARVLCGIIESDEHPSYTYAYTHVRNHVLIGPIAQSGRWAAPSAPPEPMKILLAPDSFKGTLSATEVANVLADTLRKHFPDADVRILPLSDGGEGLLDCMQTAMHGTMMTTTVQGPLGRDVRARYLLAGTTAVVEMAEAAGLPLLDSPSVMRTTTFGVGQLVAEAEAHGATHVLVGLGGSATNDAGCGMAAALGTRFWNGEGYFVPVGGTLTDVRRIEYGPLHPYVTALCDVNNPLYGPQGAAYVYGPQKGATDDDLVRLDEGLRHIASLWEADGRRQYDVVGAGAAGGLGAGIMTFLGGRLRHGIDAILDALGYDALVADADLVVTGEGRLDGQSFSGKVIDGVLARTPCPVVAFVGQIAEDTVPAAHGLAAAFDTARHLHGGDYRVMADATARLAAEDLADWIRTHIATK